MSLRSPSARFLLSRASTGAPTLAATNLSCLPRIQRANMTTALFKHIDFSSSTSSKPWTKVDGGGSSFQLRDHNRAVHNIRHASTSTNTFTTDNAGFALHHAPISEMPFSQDAAIRQNYYPEVEALLRKHLQGSIKKVVIFDHTIRRRHRDAPRQPVQQVHVDQTPSAAEVRVRRHLPAHEAEELLQGRYQIVNVWRPIGFVAEDFPLAVVDWRSTRPDDFVPVDLLYPTRSDSPMEEAGIAANDDRGREQLPKAGSEGSTEGYEVRGETLGVAANERHQFYYAKDMTPNEVMLLKCFDSRGEGLPGGWPGEALRTPHTAFVDPDTRADAPGRQSIEVRCLVFYD